MIKADEDKFMLQKIRRYFLSKGALPFEKDAYLFIDKLFQSLQSKEQEPKGSERHNCLENLYSNGAYIKCKICDTTINIKEPNP